MRIAVLGLGLIGGSIGLAARRRIGAQVCGCDPDPRAIEQALRRGAIDRAAATVAEAVHDADVVFACAPVGALGELLDAALQAAPPDCAVSDVGSIKRAPLQQLGERAHDPRLVLGHPLAGAERGGVANARAELFEGAPWCLVDAGERNRDAAERLRGLIEALGARVVEIDAESHDRLMAHVSQMPHVLANLLVLCAPGGAERCAGPSFADATRVAGASSAIWPEIYAANADLLVGALDETIAALHGVREMLAAGDRAALAAWNDSARARRETLRAGRAAAEQDTRGAGGPGAPLA